MTKDKGRQVIELSQRYSQRLEELAKMLGEQTNTGAVRAAINLLYYQLRDIENGYEIFRRKEGGKDEVYIFPYRPGEEETQN